MSSVRKLSHDLGVLKRLKKSNSIYSSIFNAEKRIAERAQQVRERVWKHAFKALAQNRKGGR